MEYGPSVSQQPGVAHRPVCPSRRHPTPVLEERGGRRVTMPVGSAAIFEDGDTTETFTFDQPRDQLQLDQIISHLVDM
jgi:hypothetical protein